MSDVDQLVFEEALLAKAAYADLTAGMSLAEVKDKFSDVGLTESMAKYFSENFKILDSELNGDGSYQGILVSRLIDNVETNEFHLLHRGSQEGLDFVIDGILATYGVAYGQIEAMEAFYQQLLSSTVFGDRLADTNNTLYVTGHSLGGHLTTLFTLMHPDEVNHAYTFNGAGVDDIPTALDWYNVLDDLTAIGYHLGVSALNILTQDRSFSSYASTQISNYFTEQGLEIVVSANSVWGSSEAITTEDGASYDALFGHAMAPLTNAIFMHYFISELDDSFSLNDIETLINSSYNNKMIEHDALIGSISKLFGRNFDPTLIDDSNTERSVNAVQEEMFNILDQLETLKNVGGVDISIRSFGGVNVDQIFQWMNEDSSSGQLTRYAVINNLPLVLIGSTVDAQMNEVLTDSSYNLDHFSHVYLLDRAELLTLMIERNLNDIPDSGFVSRPDRYEIYEDLSTGTNIKTYAFADEVDVFKFGTDGADTNDLNGGAYNDHLYGGAGDDTINGGAGRDHIEGNADNDTLHGGTESDRLYGGQGNDHLHGDQGNDYLFGGADNDTYHFKTGDGHDYITDDQGINTLIIEDRTIYQLELIDGSESAYKNSADSSDTHRYIVSSIGMTIVAENGTDIIEIQSADPLARYGINDATPSTPPASEPQPTDIIVGDGRNVQDNGTTVGTWLPGRASQNAIVTDKVIYDASLFDATLFDQDTRVGQWEFWGGSADDELTGGIENDTLHGNTGNDILIGAEGADELNGHDDNDRLSGGEGADVLVGGQGSDYLFGGTENDFLFGNGPYRHVNAETGEVINEAGSDEGDIDYLEGGEGNDYLSSGQYQDIMLGGAGEDQIYGGAGNDVLSGGSEKDFIMGDSAFNRTSYSTTGLGALSQTFTHVDHVDKQDASLSYNDTIDGGAGNDTLIGEIGDDVIKGGEGNDWIEGDKLNDSSRYGGPLGQYSTDYTLGDTTFSVDADDFVEFDAAWSGNDTLYGGAGTDTIMGNGGDDEIHGGDDNDILFGDDDLLALEDHGNDTLYGDAGEDELQGGGGNDELHGGTERDTLFGDSGDDTLYGDEGDDDLLGGEGHDKLYGGAGNDNLWGGDGNDELSGGQGSDILSGGQGNDTYVINIGDGDNHIHDTEGLSTIQFGSGVSAESVAAYISYFYDTAGTMYINYGPNSGDVLAMSLSSYSSIQNIKLFDGTSLSLVVEVWDDEFTGNERAEILVGGGIVATNNLIYGGGGNDEISGLGGDDTLYGDEGDDTLVGGEGTDHLYGGDGNDTFVYALGDGTDYIHTFDEGVGRQDILALTGGIEQEDVVLTQTNDDLIIEFLNDEGRVEIVDFFKDDNPQNALTAISFESGAQWSYAEIISRIQTIPEENIVEGTPDRDDITGTDGVDVFDGLAGDDTFIGLGGDDRLEGGSGYDSLYGGDGNDTLSGGSGGDNLYGGADNDTLSGGSWYDNLEGGTGDDVLIGGEGNDFLSGGSGKNSYRYAFGDGNDDIYPDTYGADDTLVLIDLSPDQVSLRVDSTQLIVSINATGEEITVWNFYWDDPQNLLSMSIEFEQDGIVWSDAEIRALSTTATENGDNLLGTADVDVIDGLAGDDHIYGYEGDDDLSGGAGLDHLYGGNDNDVLRGGHGNNDYLKGGEGNDTYEFSLGDGDTTIDNYDASTGKQDTLRFMSGIAPDDITLKRSGSDLKLTLSSGEVLTVLQFFRSPDFELQSVIFVDDTTVWTAETLKNSVLEGTAGNDTLIGYDGMDTISGAGGEDDIFGGDGHDILEGGENNDRLYGEKGNDTLNGGSGDDFLTGGFGNDTYLFGVGSGHDSVRNYFQQGMEEGGLNDTFQENFDRYQTDFDKILLTGGLTPEDVTFTRLAGQSDVTPYRDYDDLLLTLNATGETLRVGLFFNKTADNLGVSNIIDQIEFSNGVVWGPDEIAAVIQVQPSVGDDYLVGSDEIDIIHGLDGDDVIWGGRGSDQLFGGQGKDVLIGNQGNDLLDGGDDDDTISGITGSNTLIGGKGDDYLNGGDFEDTLIGGLGNDHLAGGAGNNTFIYAQGDGQDSLSLSGDENRLKFNDSTQLEDLQFLRSANDMVVTFNNNHLDTIRVEGYFYSESYKLDVIEFADSSEITNLLTDGVYLKVGHVGNVSGPYEPQNNILGNAGSIVGGGYALWGTSYNDVLIGSNDDDNLYSQGGNDLIIGGQGDDLLEGGLGESIFLINEGDGHDIIYNGGNSTVQFGAGINIEELQLEDAGLSWVLHASDSQSLRLRKNESLTFQFNNDTSYSQLDLVNALQAQNNAPVLVSPISDFTLSKNQTIDIELHPDTFIDSDIGDSISYSASMADGSLLPEWLNFTAQHREFQGSGLDHPGEYEIKVTATDSMGLSAFTTFTLTITDAINGNNTDESLYGTQGTDEIFGLAGSDKITGSGGDDLLVGGEGDDTYIYSYVVGDGLDIIDNSDSSGGYDAIEIELGYDFNIDTDLKSTDQISISYSGDDMILSIGSGSITILNQFKDAGTINNSLYAIDEIRFIPADGITPYEVWTIETMTADKAAADLGDNTFDVVGGEVIEALEDQVQVITFDELLANDTGSNLSITHVSGDANGSYELDPTNRLISFTPLANFSGLALFSYTVSDGELSSIVNASFNVSAVNDIPEAAADSASTPEDTLVVIDVLSNDSDIDGDSLTIDSASAANGSVTINGDGTLSYSPNSDFNGTDTISYSISDGNGGTSSSTITVIVNPENDDPVAVVDTASTLEDTTVIINALGNDSDVDGDSLTVDSASASNGSVTINGDGTLSYNPNVDFNGTDTISYSISDGNGGTSSSTVTVIVNPENDDPVAVVDAASTLEDTSVVINVLGNDSDVDGDSLTVDSASASNGSVIINGDGTLSYNPNADFNGTDTISYSISDGNGGASSSTVVVMVNPDNDDPVTVIDTASTLEDTAVVINVLGNDSDIDGDSLTIDSASAINGSVSINGDGTVTYAPNANFNGSDTISYSIIDGNGGTASSTVALTVNPYNDDPVTVVDTASTLEDTSVVINVLTNDSDIDGDSLTVDSASAVNGSVTINGDGTITYAPNTGFNGADSISYQVSDGNGGSSSSTVSVNVGAQNDEPVAVIDTASTLEDTSVIINVLANDSDIDGDSLTIDNASAINGSVTINGDGTLNYMPNADFNGSDTISYSVTDGNGGTASSTVAVTVNPDNDEPIAVIDTASTLEDTSVVIDVLTNDSDIDGDNLTVDSASALNGSVIINGDGTLNYIPNVDFNGSDTISYSITDGNGGTASSTVAVTVTSDNDEPVAVIDTASTLEDTSVVINVLANDSDIDGDSLTVDSVSALNGSVTINVDGTLSYVPDENYYGSDTISYSVTDGNGGTASSTVAVTVSPENDDPELSIPLLDQTAIEGDLFTFNIPSESFSDIDLGDTLTYSASLVDGSILPSWLSFDSDTLSITGTASLSDVGNLDIKVVVTDSFGASAEDVFNLAISAAEDLPLNITGTGSSEVLVGGNADDYINAKGGSDNVRGFGGKDTLLGAGGSDYLYGDEGDDTLNGGSGHDHLFGGEGNDLLVGGTGNDTYYFGLGDGYDRINNASNKFASETDKINLSGVAKEDVWFKKTNNHLDVYLLGTNDHLRVNNWYKAEKFELDRIDLGNSSIDAAGIEQLVNAMASFGAPSGGSINLSNDEQQQVSTAIAASWQ